MKVGAFIKFNHSLVDEPESLDPITINIPKSKESRIQQINKLYEIKFKGNHEEALSEEVSN